MSVAASLYELGIGGFVEAGRDLRFADAASEARSARRGDILVPLVDRAAIVARGAEAAAFLQGQLSNDVAALAVGDAQLSSYCNPKGRVLALGVLHRVDVDHYRFEIDASLAAETFKRLRLYVLRNKLVLSLDTSIAFGLAGDATPTLLARCSLPVPEQPWRSLQTEHLRVLRRPGGRPRFSLHGDATALGPLWPTLAETATPAGPAAWRLLDIDAGLPNVVTATRELFVPQMLNLDAIGGISFTKGCYPGQEIVARLHYLGSAKRRMFRAAVDGTPPQPGDTVHRKDDPADSAAIGEVVDAAPVPDGASAVLVVLQLAHANGALTSADGRPLTAIEALVER